MKLTTKLVIDAQEIALLKSVLKAKNDFVKGLPNMGVMVDEDDYKMVEKLFSYVEINCKATNSFHNLGYVLKIKDTMEFDLSIELSPELLAAICEYEMAIFETIMPVMDSVYALFMSLTRGQFKAQLKEISAKHEHLFKNLVKEKTTRHDDEVN